MGRRRGLQRTNCDHVRISLLLFQGGIVTVLSQLIDRDRRPSWRTDEVVEPTDIGR